MCTNFKKNISGDAIRDYIGNWHKKWLAALGRFYFIDERRVLEKMFQREVINEELSMPCNTSISPQHQILCVHFVIEFSTRTKFTACVRISLPVFHFYLEPFGDK